MLLSRRESQVVELMGKGLSRAEISDRLGVSRKCVSVFIEAVCFFRDHGVALSTHPRMRT